MQRMHCRDSKIEVRIIQLSSLSRSSYIVYRVILPVVGWRFETLGHLRISVGDGELDCPISPTKIKKIMHPVCRSIFCSVSESPAFSFR